MAIIFDPAKDRANLQKHGISLAKVEEVEWGVGVEDARKAYGERRFRAFGLIDGKPYCLVFTRRGDDLRAISLRRASQKEFRRYAT